MTGTVVITGGSRGIGAATAVLAAEREWQVAVSFRERRDAAEQVVRRCQEAGVRAVAVQADVSAEDDVRRLLDTVCDQLGVPTGLVNNAGIVAPRGRLADFTTERIARVVSVNLVGTLLCTREAVRRMSVRHGGNGGAIVNVSSRAAVRGSPNEYVDYAAAKAGVDALTVGLARELADDGIRVNAVRPALIDTEIHEPGRLAQLGHAVPLGRPGRAGEVAAAILWLLSDEASFTTGTFIDVAGGW